jgi:hypothetical protein
MNGANHKRNNREYMRRRRTEWREARKCHSCGAPPREERTTCLKCAEASRVRNQRNKESISRAGKALRAERKARGLCAQCGQYSRPGKTICQGCLDLRRTKYVPVVTGTAKKPLPRRKASVVDRLVALAFGPKVRRLA